MTETAPDTVQTVLLRLHVDEAGSVWYGHDRCFAEDSGLGASDFLKRHEEFGFQLDGVQQARLLGTVGNSELIVGLHQRRRRRPRQLGHQRLQLASPSVCPSAASRADPPQVLQLLWQPTTSGHTSGFRHDLNEKEFPTYALINSLSWCDEGRLDDRTTRILHYHPAWPALSFLPTLSPWAAAHVLTTVVDPRWFRDIAHHNRLSRLFVFLGLTPENVAAFVAGRRGPRHYDRFKNVLDAWAAVGAATANPDDPRNFLWRILHHHKGQKGLLRACQWFVRFVREVWLHELGSSEPEAVFVPGDFFRHAEEVRAYVQHREALKIE